MRPLGGMMGRQAPPAGRMIISFIAAEMNIDFENAGSTTFKQDRY
jgi:hypothetical protein